jgi:hypothetical protein
VFSIDLINIKLNSLKSQHIFNMKFNSNLLRNFGEQPCGKTDVFYGQDAMSELTILNQVLRSQRSLSSSRITKHFMEMKVKCRFHKSSSTAARLMKFQHRVTLRNILKLLSIYDSLFLSVSFLLVLTLKICMHFASLPCVVHVLPISSCLTWLF